MAAESGFPAWFFEREDDSDDGLFYLQPRKVVHIDDSAIAALGRLVQEVVPPGAVALDLMSSWRSHWPDGHPKRRLVGLGLNREEMDDNPALDEVVVHDVNRGAPLPFAEATFDAALLTVSAQYLTRPVDTFREVNRVLQTGGRFIVSFSNRMFPTKAVRGWRNASDRGRVDLVGTYMELAGNFEDILGLFLNPQESPPADPMFAVHARKAA